MRLWRTAAAVLLLVLILTITTSDARRRRRGGIIRRFVRKIVDHTPPRRVRCPSHKSYTTTCGHTSHYVWWDENNDIVFKDGIRYFRLRSGYVWRENGRSWHGRFWNRLTHRPGPGDYDEGTYKLSYSAKDKAGNVNNGGCTFNIEIKVLRCTKLYAPPNGEIHCTDGNLGTSSCHFKCKSGYELHGTEVATCRCHGSWASWSTSTPTCRAVHCPQSQSIDNATLHCSNGYVYRSTCSYKCYEGFTVGKGQTSSRTCQSNRLWSGSTPSCSDTTIPVLKLPANIILYADKYVNTTRVVWDYPVAIDNSGEVVSVQQESGPTSGDTLEVGNYTVTYTATDTSGNQARASFHIIIRDVTCPDLFINHSQSIQCSHDFTFGSNCTVQCPVGYVINGTKTLTCEGEVVGNEMKGVWSDQQPTCDVVYCPELSAPDRGQFRNGTMSCPTVYGSWCYIECNEGMHMLGSSSRHCLSRPGEAEGYWDGEETRCEAIYPCPSPYVAPNARIINETECPTGTDVSTGTICRYACVEGHVLVGPETITCNYNGWWSDSYPRCQVITCESAAAPVPTNGYRHGCSTDKIPYGTTCVLGCNVGYMPTNTTEVTCTTDENGLGIWDRTTTTVCEIVKCVPYDPPSNGFIQECTNGGNQTDINELQGYQTVCRGECDEGFTPSGTTNRKCLLNGQWDGVALECQDTTPPTVECPGSVTSFALPMNDFVVSSFPWEPLKVVDVSPPVDVQLFSINSVKEGENRTTLFKEGFYSFLYFATDQKGNTGSCTVDLTVRVTRCPPLNIPQNGDADLIAGSGSCTDYSVLGSMCSFSCDYGYHLAGGEDEMLIECMTASNTSTVGYWDTVPQSCIANTCSVPSVQKGYISGCFGTQVDYQTTCTFHCNTGFQSPTGITSLRRTCMADGSWTQDKLMCEAVRCFGNFSLENGEVIPTNCTTLPSLPYASVCQFTCNDGFRQIGPSSKSCSKDGSWNNPQNVACIDEQAPRFVVPCPQYVEVYAESGSTEAVVNYVIPEVTDNAGAENVVVTKQSGQESGSRFGEGSHIIAFSAADEAGNHARCDIRVTVLVHRCSSIQAPASGSLDCPSRILGANCSFHCNGGYDLEGADTIYCVLESSIPSWNETQPKCSPVHCPAIPSRPLVIKSDCEQPSEPYGTVCLFACPYGYQGIGNSSRACQADGSWSGEEFTCEEKQCPSFDIPVDISEQPVNCNVNPSYEDTCYLSCRKQGYRIEPSTVDLIHCRGDGQWSQDTSSMMCKDIESPRFTKCPQDFTVYASRGATQAMVKWEVTAIDNSEEAVFPYCDYIFMSYPIGEYDTMCQASDSAGNEATCRFTFSVRTWNCQQLSPPMFGKFVGPCPTIYGSECTVGCIEGYELEGSDKASCERNEETMAMYWQREDDPVCKISSCPAIPQEVIPAEVGGVSPNHCTGPEQPTYGVICRMFCRNDYTLIGYSDPISCQSDGTWDVDLDAVEFRCEDQVKPVIEVCPSDQYANLENGTTDAVIHFDIPSARDNSGSELEVIKTPADIHSPYSFMETTVVTYEFIDDANNSATCTFQVAVLNNLFPEVEYCPEDMRVQATGSLTVVTWTEPSFSEPSGDDDALLTSCNFVSGTNFMWGTHNIICTATNINNGNTAECRFSVEVYPKSCPPLRAPRNGAMACDAWVYGQFCNQQCNAEYDVPPGNYDPFFICGSSGMWAKSEVVDCSMRRQAGSCNLGSELQYYSGDCSDPETQRAIQEAFIELMNSTDTISDACGTNQDCRAENVNVTCGSGRSRRGSNMAERQTIRVQNSGYDYLRRYRANQNKLPARIQELFRKHEAKRAARKAKQGYITRNRRSTSDFVVTVTFSIVAEMSTTEDNYEDQVYSTMDTLYDIVDELEVEAESGALTPNVTNLDMEAQEDPLSYDYPKPTCESGSGLSWGSLACVACSPGTYYEANGDSCILCPIAQYQDDEAQEQCKQCPVGTTTLEEGAQNQTQCLQMCQAGQYSLNGVEPCALCEIGFYQPSENKTSCIQCPELKKTLQKGATSNDLCLAECSPGNWSNTGLEPCQACPIRYYQPDKGQRSCNLCPGITTTLTVGATYETQCNVTAQCEEDNCLNGATCLPLIEGPVCQCPVGFEGDHCEVNVDDCHELSCDNGGTCIDGINNFTCICPEGFQGDDCSTDILECDTTPCYNASTCVDTPGSFVCECINGFTGQLCEEEIQPCKDEPCKNGATCASLVEDFVCTCAPGYTGDLCETDVDDCKTSPCNNGGTCVDLPNAFECSCTPGYAGATCEVDLDLCDPNPCIHGMCNEEENSFTCICDKGMAGSLCDRNATACDKEPCVHGLCSLTDGNGFSCNCTGTGYAGIYCDTLIDHCSGQPCSNGGTCQNHPTGYVCLCHQNFTGVNCEQSVNPCDEMPCQNNGSCISDALSFHCVCPVGFEGQRCEIPWVICKEGFCQNEGHCGNKSNTDFCVCRDGFTGVACEKEIDECISGPCENDGVCLDEINNYTCQCTPGFDGRNCQNDIDECYSSSCEHGVCVDGINNYTCDCFDGYEGFDCDVNIDDCIENDCINGECVDGNNTYTCNCLKGYRGRLCDEDIDECASIPCVNAEECVDGIGSFECICQEGWTGKQCEASINDCSSDACDNGGTCIDQHQYFSCVCMPGYTGDTCSEDINECLSGPCINGTCIDEVNGYSCTCPRGRDGRQCQIPTNVCHPNPCSNGGTCSLDGEKFSCFCQSGFIGEECEVNVDDCVGNRCSNGATCRDEVNTYSCLCSPGYSGDYCEDLVDLCLVYPCQNGGTCNVVENKVVCTCPSGYGGTLCERNINDCLPNPCLHGGSCVDGLNSFTCQCTPGYRGIICDEEINECLDNDCDRIGSSRCQDGVGSYKCICRHGFSGELCDKVGESNFDMLFKEGEEDQYVLLRKFSTEAVSSFTIALWIRTSSPDAVILSHQAGESQAVPNLVLDNPASLTAHIKGNEMSTDVAINDDLWHHIAVTFDDVAKLTLVYINGSLVKEQAIDVTDVIVPSGMFLLGQSRNAAQALLSGSLSRLNMWDEVFDENQIYNLSKACYVPVPGNVIGMVDFLDGEIGDVAFVDPSICDVTNDCAGDPCANGGRCVDGYHEFRCECAAGFRGPLCEENPDDCVEQLCQNSAACVDGLGAFTCSCAEGFSGDLCELVTVNGGWSEWSDWSPCSKSCDTGQESRTRECNNPSPENGGSDCGSANTETRDCNTDKCPHCKKFKKPWNGYARCSTDQDGETVCHIFCYDGYDFSVMPKEEYLCGPSTEYIWSHETHSNPHLVVPACIQRKNPKELDSKVTYTYPDLSCSDLSAEEASAVESNIVIAASAVGQETCTGECRLTSVTADGCSRSATKKRRSTPDGVNGTMDSTNGTSDSVNSTAGPVNVTVTMVFTQAINVTDGNLTDSYKLEDEPSAVEAMNHLTNVSDEIVARADEGALRVSTGGQIYDPTYEDDDGAAVCEPGSIPVFNTTLCVSCEAGTFQNGVDCTSCLFGTYQPEDGKTSCVDCPEGRNNTGLGSISEDECLPEPIS